MTRMLIVEEDEAAADRLACLVQKEGFMPVVVSTGQQALHEFDRNGSDFVLLDLAVPGMSGTDVCRQLRQRSMVPVIIVSDCDSEVDKVVGLEVGADDYVTKPYSSRELIARVRAVLRRGAASNVDDGRCTRAEPAPSMLGAGPVRMDTDRHFVTVRGSEVHMPLKEFELLLYMLRNVGRALPRKELIDQVWGTDYYGDTKTLDVHIRRLRSKIEIDPSAPRILINVRGLGFKFEVEEQTLSPSEQRARRGLAIA